MRTPISKVGGTVPPIFKCYRCAYVQHDVIYAQNNIKQYLQHSVMHFFVAIL